MHPFLLRLLISGVLLNLQQDAQSHGLGIERKSRRKMAYCLFFSRRFWVTEPRHSETISDKKCHLCRTTRGVRGGCERGLSMCCGSRPPDNGLGYNLRTSLGMDFRIGLRIDLRIGLRIDVGVGSRMVLGCILGYALGYILGLV